MSQKINFSGGSAFFANCIQYVASYNAEIPGQASANISNSPREWSRSFTALEKNGCLQTRRELGKFVVDSINKLNRIQRNCGQAENTCIAELQKKVALRSLGGGFGAVFFQDCRESPADAQQCCSDSPMGCSRYGEIQRKYQKAIAQNPEQCSANTAYSQSMKREMGRDIPKFDT